jgi:hypothetical protein
LGSIDPVEIDERVERMNTAKSVSRIIPMADQLCDS